MYAVLNLYTEEYKSHSEFWKWDSDKCNKNESETRIVVKTASIIFFPRVKPVPKPIYYFWLLRCYHDLSFRLLLTKGGKCSVNTKCCFSLVQDCRFLICKWTETSLWRVSGKSTVSDWSKLPSMCFWSYCVWTVGFFHAFFFQPCTLHAADFNIASWISLYDVISEINLMKDKLSDLKSLFCNDVLNI